MKNPTLVSILIFMMMSQVTAIHAQKLTVRLDNGNEKTDFLSDVQKLYFSQGQLMVDLKSGADDLYTLEEVRKIYFDATVSVVDHNALESSGLLVFPNPAGERITVSGMPEGTNRLSVYRIDGALVLTKEVYSAKETLEIGSLSSGIYFIHVSGLTSKFVRK